MGASAELVLKRDVQVVVCREGHPTSFYKNKQRSSPYTIGLMEPEVNGWVETGNGRNFQLLL